MVFIFASNFEFSTASMSTTVPCPFVGVLNAAGLSVAVGVLDSAGFLTAVGGARDTDHSETGRPSPPAGFLRAMRSKRRGRAPCRVRNPAVKRARGAHRHREQAQ